jgi:ligand-binding sensor protein
MELTDILSLKKWEELEKEINQRFGLNASVFDKDGIRITDFKKWANNLCPVIKANKRGQSYICAVAHQNIAAEAEKTRQPVVGECDAGFVKIAIPIFASEEFLGVVGGCGRIFNGNRVESFFINKLTGIDKEIIRKLTADVSPMTTEDSEKIVEFIKKRVNMLLEELPKPLKQHVKERTDAFHHASAN